MTEQHDDARLRGLAQRLGERAAEHLDVEATARAVVGRLRAERTAALRGPRVMQRGWLRMAAGLVLVAGGAGVLWTRLGTSRGHESHYVAEDLQGLTAAQLREVLGTLDATLGGTDAAAETEDDDLSSMTSDDLRALLRALEG